MELHTRKMVASLEYAKIQNLICNNSITHWIMTDIYNSVHMKYNNKHNRSQDYGHSVGLRSIIIMIHLTVQLISMYYLLYKEMSFLATLASMSFFERSDTYNLYSFVRVGYKNDVKTAKIYGNTCFFIQASDFVIIYLNKIKFCVALSTICDTFLHINEQKCYFHLFGRNKFFRL